MPAQVATLPALTSTTKSIAAQRGADPGAVAAIKARLKELLSVGMKKG